MVPVIDQASNTNNAVVSVPVPGVIPTVTVTIFRFRALLLKLEMQNMLINQL